MSPKSTTTKKPAEQVINDEGWSLWAQKQTLALAGENQKILSDPKLELIEADQFGRVTGHPIYRLGIACRQNFYVNGIEANVVRLTFYDPFELLIELIRLGGRYHPDRMNMEVRQLTCCRPEF